MSISKKTAKPKRKVRDDEVPAHRLKSPLTKYQSFEALTISRDQIKGATYNPRQIDEHAAKKLKKNLKKVGLLETLVWNKRTGNLVGGHQRLAILDSLERKRGPNYQLTVSAVDLDEKTEREQNIFLNNPSAQGTWDPQKIADMLKDTDIKIDIASTGFDPADIAVIVDDPDLVGQMFQPDELTQEALNGLNEVGVHRGDPDSSKRSKSDDESDTTEGSQLTPEEIAKYRQDRRDWREAAKQSKSDPNLFMVVFFKDRTRRDKFLRRVGVRTDERYVEGERLMTCLGMKTGDEEE